MSLSNIKNSLLSSRRFLWRLKERLRSDGNSSARKSRNFTFDHDRIKEYKRSKTHTVKWILLLPAVLIIIFSGFFILTAVVFGLFLMHGIKMLWEGYSFNSKRKKSFSKVRLLFRKRCRRVVLQNFKTNMKAKGSIILQKQDQLG